MPPLSVAEPARPSAEAPHVPGETAVSVIGDPPGALVAFDDHDSLQCTTPCQIFLAAGRHTWRATLSGYRDGLGVFTIEKGKKPSSVKVSLDAKVGFVTVESNICLLYTSLGFAGCACCFFCAAHLARCAAAILARPALLIVRRFRGPA